MANLRLTFALLTCLACTSTFASTLLPFTKLYAEHKKYNDQFISVRGIVAIDELGHQYLFNTLDEARVKNFSISIDLLPFFDDERSIPQLRDLACAEMYGKFESWDVYLPTGYLLSKAGGLRVKRVSACSNQPVQ